MDLSPLGKKPRRFQEAIRLNYGALRYRIEGSKYAPALLAAAEGRLQGQFVSDYPRFAQAETIVAGGYLVSHIAARRRLSQLRSTKRALFNELPHLDDWHFGWKYPRLSVPDDVEVLLQAASAWSNWSPVLSDAQTKALEDEKHAEDDHAARRVYSNADCFPRRHAQVQAMSTRVIHDVDKPQRLDDGSVRDVYGNAILD